VNLLDETKLLLKKYHVHLKERLGQNFIVDEGAVERQIQYAKLCRDDTVIEFGAGLGTLTKVLIENSGKVIAVEKDSLLAKILRDRFTQKNLEVIEGDALKITWPSFNKTVSNIPYSISSPLTFRILKSDFEVAILTYQKEFAERLVAKPGTPDYSRLSIATYYYADAEILEVLPPKSFYPPPKVDSAVVKLTPKIKKPFSVDEDFFLNTLRGLFVHKKKTVKNALYHSREIFGFKDGKEWKKILNTFIPAYLLEKRVFMLDPEEVAEVCNILKEMV